MKIIILGIGTVGEILIKNLAEEGHDIVAIDKDSMSVDSVVNRYDVNGFIGSGIERDILTQSGVNTADIFIACTGYDEINVLSCVLAKKLGTKRTIARVRAPELFKEMPNIRGDLGVDVVFNPELRTAYEIAQLLKFPSANKVEGFAGGRAIMAEFIVGKNNPMINKNLIEISSYGYKILFAMVVSGEEVIIPKGDYVVKEGDRVCLIAPEEEITAFSKKLKIFKPQAKSAFIVGGSKVAYYLVKELASKGVDVKLIEKNEERCKLLSEEISSITVLCGDGTDQSILAEENIKGSDAFIALTGQDETNVIVSLYARQKGVNKVVTKINKENVLDMVKTLGLDSIIAPKDVVANYILKYVRSYNFDLDNNINALYKLNDSVELVEFTIGKQFDFEDVALKDLKLKSDILIGGIVRSGKFILPTGETAIKSDDRVIIVAKKKQINKLTDIFR